MKDIRSVSVRKGGDIQPADESEIGAILRRRLFATIDMDAAQAAADEYASYYGSITEQVGASKGLLDSASDRIVDTYPFHPALVDVLDKRIGTIPNFQRTRGALRLLSRVVAVIWDDKDNAPGILNVADVPLDDDDVVRQLTVRIDRSQYQQVIQADIAGANAHAPAIDQKDYQNRPVTQRAATSVLAHSLEQTASTGATIPDAAVGSLRPGDDPALIEDSLHRLYGRAWHLTFDNIRWRFQPEPNANRIIASEADRVLNSVVTEKREEILRRMLKPTPTIATDVYPMDLDGIADEAKLHLAAPHHDTVSVEARNADTAPALLQQARGEYHGKPRRHRNGIAYLVADKDRVEAMDRAVRYMIAARAIAGDETRLSGFGDEVRKKIKDAAYKSRLEAHVALGRCYRHLYYPAANRHNADLDHAELTADVQGALGDGPAKSSALAAGKAWTDEVWNTLVKVEKVRASDKALAAEWIQKKAWLPKDADRIRTATILDGFWTDHSQPLLTDTSPVAHGVQDGVKQGLWVLQDMRDATDSRGKVWSNQDGSTPRQVVFGDDVWLVLYKVAIDEGLLATPTTVADIVSIVEKAADVGIAAPELRTALEKAKRGHEPAKAEVRDALAEAVRQRRVTVTRDDTTVKAGELSGDKVGFDDLVVKPYEAEEGGYDPRIVKTKTFEGNTAQEVEKLKTWAAELISGGHTAGIVEVTVTVAVDEADPTAADMLISLLGSVPTLAATVSVNLVFPVEGAEGDVTVSVNAAARTTAQQKVAPLLAAVSAKAGAPYGDAAAKFVFDEPHAPDSPAAQSLFDAVKMFFTGAVRLAAKVA